MIFWKDFILDDEFGPTLLVNEKRGELTKEGLTGVCDREVSRAVEKHQDDARAKKIQETGQEQRPARMVGLPSSESSASQPRTGALSDSNSLLQQERGRR